MIEGCSFGQFDSRFFSPLFLQGTIRIGQPAEVGEQAAVLTCPAAYWTPRRFDALLLFLLLQPTYQTTNLSISLPTILPTKSQLSCVARRLLG